MSEVTIKRVYRKLTAEERERHRKIREEVERDKPRITTRALLKKAEMEAAFHAMQTLKQERQRRNITLGQLAKRSGIDKSNLSKLENDINANPTLDTLIRIAQAIGVTLTIGVKSAA